MLYIPTQIEPYRPTTLYLAWKHGENFALAYREIRLACPCPQCIEKYTGKRMVIPESIHPEICPLQVQWIGKYGIQMNWSDGHDLSIYPYDRLYELCKNHGQLLE